VGFRIPRFEADSLDKLRSRFLDGSCLEQHQSEVIVSFREIRFPAHDLPEDIRGAGRIVLLAEDQSPLYPGVSVLGFKADRLIF